MDKSTLDILIDALSEKDWHDLKFRAETKRAWQLSSVSHAKRESAIQFGDWILKHTVYSGYDEDMSECWVTRFGDETTYYTTSQLYDIYLRRQWDVTLNDELDENLL